MVIVPALAIAVPAVVVPPTIMAEPIVPVPSFVPSPFVSYK